MRHSGVWYFNLSCIIAQISHIYILHLQHKNGLFKKACSFLHLFHTSLTYNSQTKLAPTAKSCLSTFIEAATGECPSAADPMALTMSSGTVIGIPVLPLTLTAKSSSTQDSSCCLQDRIYMRQGH